MRFMRERQGKPEREGWGISEGVFRITLSRCMIFDFSCVKFIEILIRLSYK
jgi:hypothetical protein